MKMLESGGLMTGGDDGGLGDIIAELVKIIIKW